MSDFGGVSPIVRAADLDGNVMRFGSEPKAERPIGEWLDMRGVPSKHVGEGQWTRVTP